MRKKETKKIKEERKREKRERLHRKIGNRERHKEREHINTVRSDKTYESE